jgi:hypothetical protein
MAPGRRAATAEEERFEAALRWMAADERGLLILRKLVAPAFQQPTVDPQLCLVDAGIRADALNWLRAIVTHAPGSLASVVIRVTKGGEADADGAMELGVDDPALAGRSGGHAESYAYPAADQSVIAGATGDPDDRHAAAIAAALATRG